jgi:hypothetical protein
LSASAQRHVEGTNASAGPNIGNSVATANAVWLGWGSASGIHISKIDGSGSWTRDALPQPVGTDTSPDRWYNVAFVPNADETDGYLMYERWAPDVGFSEYRGSYRGGWSIVADSWAGAGWNGASVWSPVVLPRGVGVMAYDYAEWMKPPLHWHIHVDSF